VGTLFSLAAIVSIPILIYLPKALHKTGNIRVTLIALILEGIALFGLTFSTSLLIVALAFIAHYILIRVLFLNTDIILETLSLDSATGRIRGVFLTAVNVGLVLSPIISGFLLRESNAYTRIFFASIAALIPTIIFLLMSLRHFKDSPQTHTSLLPALCSFWKRPALRNIFFANFLLRMFYAVMVVYMGIYLHTTVGMPWSDIGIVFTIMLVPFALFSYPLGRLADLYWGEKEMLIGGFIFTGITTFSIAWIGTTNILVWASILLATRIGAATIEIMTESYFFKQIGKEDVAIVSLYRIVEPVGYVVAPLLFSISLMFIDVRFVFVVLGILMLVGILPVSVLRDTK
jgi:MFS family permease